MYGPGGGNDGGGGGYGGDRGKGGGGGGHYGGGGYGGGGGGYRGGGGGGDRYGGGGGGGGYGGDRGGGHYGGGGGRGGDRGGPPNGGGGGGDRGRNWRERELGGSSGGAAHLARIHGTEEDRVNCPFYFKIGACRHGERCSRQHHKPPFSQTVLVKHMWTNPQAAVAAAGGDITTLDAKQGQDDFDDFYEEIYEEMASFGPLEEVNVCENLGEHIVGNVYIKFEDEEDAAEALQGLYGRFYAGKQLEVEYSPVTDFREARCRQFDETNCSRGGYCNFMHIKQESKWLRKEIERANRKRAQQKAREAREKSRSRSGSPRRRENDRQRGSSRSPPRSNRSRSPQQSKEGDFSAAAAPPASVATEASHD